MHSIHCATSLLKYSIFFCRRRTCCLWSIGPCSRSIFEQQRSRFVGRCGCPCSRCSWSRRDPGNEFQWLHETEFFICSLGIESGCLGSVQHGSYHGFDCRHQRRPEKRTRRRSAFPSGKFIVKFHFCFLLKDKLSRSKVTDFAVIERWMQIESVMSA